MTDASNTSTGCVAGSVVGMPVCRPMGKGLFESRSDISSGRICRVLFGVAGGKMILLHGFVKKTRTTPKADLDLAAQRLKEIAS